MPLHKSLLPQDMHALVAWVFANEAARLAQSVVASDLNKVAYQTDTKGVFVLTSTSPVTWSQVFAGSTTTTGDGLSLRASVPAELNPESCTVHLALIPVSAGRHQPGLAVCQESNGCANIWSLGRPAGQQVATPASGGFDAKMEMYASDDGCVLSMANQSGPTLYQVTVSGSQSPVVTSDRPVLYAHVVDIPGPGDLVLRSPNGSRWSLKVDNAGVLSVVPAL